MKHLGRTALVLLLCLVLCAGLLPETARAADSADNYCLLVYTYTQLDGWGDTVYYAQVIRGDGVRLDRLPISKATYDSVRINAVYRMTSSGTTWTLTAPPTTEVNTETFSPNDPYTDYTGATRIWYNGGYAGTLDSQVNTMTPESGSPVTIVYTLQQVGSYTLRRVRAVWFLYGSSSAPASNSFVYVASLNIRSQYVDPVSGRVVSLYDGYLNGKAMSDLVVAAPPTQIGFAAYSKNTSSGVYTLSYIPNGNGDSSGVRTVTVTSDSSSTTVPECYLQPSLLYLRSSAGWQALDLTGVTVAKVGAAAGTSLTINSVADLIYWVNQGYRATITLVELVSNNAHVVGGQAIYVTNITAASPLTLKSVTANKTAATPSETITWTADATGGDGTLQYCFYLFKNGKILQRGAYGTAKTFSYTANEAGTYTVRVYVKDASDKALNLTSAGTVVGVPLELNGVTANKTSAAPGETITWTASAAGGSSVQYCFYIFKNGKILQRGTYGSAMTCSYKASDPGTYSARVYAKDGSAAALQAESGNTVVASPLVLSGITANKTSAKPGDTVTWTVSASGGSAVKYCFYLFKDGKILQRGSYGTAKTFSYTLSSPGAYTVRVYAKDGSAAALQKEGGKVTVAPAEPLAISIVASDKTTSSAGQAVTWVASASGGTGNYQYCFYVFKNGKIAARGSYGTATTFTYTPSAAGTWTVRVYVKDSSGTVVSKDNAAAVTVS